MHIQLAALKTNNSTAHLSTMACISVGELIARSKPRLMNIAAKLEVTDTSYIDSQCTADKINTCHFSCTFLCPDVWTSFISNS